MKMLVVIPTYNEIENIQQIVPQILAQNLNLEILVVDDSSPDGTGDEVNKLSQKFSGVHLLTRPGKQGLGRAYVAGFKWGMEKGYDVFVEMDADFSHRPVDLKPLLSALQNNDFAVGSRYVSGGGVVNWGLGRKIISRGGSLYSRIILGYPINDWTGGFNAWKRSVLEKINLDTLDSQGYSFQVEMKYRASRAGFKGQEVPIIFEDRRVGQSKMSYKIVVEAFYRVWMMKFNS